MSDAAAAPLVPAYVDLRDFAYMPLGITQLRRSKAWLLAKKQPELAFYMINLWTSSWHEVPAASLEDDDEVLADAAMCSTSKWAKVKALVLRGWVKCTDGRLYHKIVAAKAIEAWAAKTERRKRTEAARAAKETARNRERDNDSNNLCDRDSNSNVTGSKGREGKGIEGKLKTKTSKPTAAAPPGLPVSAELWQQFREVRIKLKAAMTPYAEELLVKELNDIAGKGGDPKATVEQSIKRGWKGFFPVDRKQKTTLAERRADNMADIRGEKNERTIDADPVGRAPVRPALRDLREPDDDDVG